MEAGIVNAIWWFEPLVYTGFVCLIIAVLISTLLGSSDSGVFQTAIMAVLFPPLFTSGVVFIIYYVCYIFWGIWA